MENKVLNCKPKEKNKAIRRVPDYILKPSYLSVT